uniref:Fibroblast growth factor receptor 2-like n=1 Tax=Crassostrea virginica TaxID=6565 RepID=A0A8B8CM06_CRAVI|nr:fibroblast growth factor receptor 2-like [Crassostrea virginica]
MVERKQCTIFNEEASITCVYEGFPEKSTDVDMYENTSTIKINASQNPDRKGDLENELEVLKQIESKDFHRNVTRLLAFNQSFPKFYIKERLPGDNLQRRLLEARDKEKIIPIFDLIRIIIQAVQGVIYVHSHGCLVRDITTASFGCTVTSNGYILKLKNFEMAAKQSDFSDVGIIGGLIDLDFSGVPVRWAAPESLLEGHYSIYSDVWSVNILADEILNYAAWPYSDISDADINDMIIHIVFTHLKPQGFNRPRRVQGLILEGLATVPEQRLKLEALRARLLEILDNIDGGGSCTLYDTYSGVESSSTKTYGIPPLSECQIKANSIFERGIPPSIQKYRELDEDPATAFAMEIAENNRRLKEQSGIDLMEISSDDNYKIESEGRTGKINVTERVTDDFLKYTYNRLKEIDSKRMCVEPWPPNKSVSSDGTKLQYRFPRSTRLLDIVLHKDRGETIGPYIELLYELANQLDTFHSAGWIFRSIRAKNVWILETKKKEQNIVIPKFGKYRMIVSSEYDTHLEQIKVENREDVDAVQW